MPQRPDTWLPAEAFLELSNRCAAAANAKVAPPDDPTHWMRVAATLQHIMWQGFGQILVRLDHLIELRERELGVTDDTPEAN